MLRTRPRSRPHRPAAAIVSAAVALALPPAVDAASDRAAFDELPRLREPAPTSARPASVSPEGAEALAAATETPAIESRPLGGFADANEGKAGAAPIAESLSASGWLRTIGALGAVIGLIVLLKFVLTRAGKRVGLAGQLGAGGRAPSGLLQVLGRYPVSRSSTLVLLQLDRRVLLLDHTPNGFSTLAEVTDAEDVASILVKTRDQEGASQVARFNAMLKDLERDPTLDTADAGWGAAR